MSDRPRIFHEYSNGSLAFVNSWSYSWMVSLHEIGIEPAERIRASRNPLEKVWSLTVEEFSRKSGKLELIPTYNAAHEETISMTESIVKVENEIDARVKSLYGVD